MRLSSETMRKLMAYADGELEGVERREAELLLATEPDALRFIDQIAGLGELVEIGHEARSGTTIASFDVADAVMALTDAPTLSKPAPVASLAAASAARAKRGQALKIGAGIAATLALAASVFFVLQHRDEETPMARGPSVPAVQLVQPAPAASAVASASAGTGVDVSTAQSAGSSVSVFYLPTGNDLSTSVVVWVDETGEK